MKKFFLLLFCAGSFAAGAVQAASSDLIARIHFAGAERISADPNSRAFTNEFCSSEARALENQTLDKLARAPGAWFRSKITAGAGDGAERLRPLLDDLLRSEWVFEMRDTTNGSPEYALAIRLPGDRVKLWQENLQNVIRSWTKLPAQKIPGGWELKKHQPPNLLRTTYQGGWLVIGCGQNELPLTREKIQEVGGPVWAVKSPVNDNGWFSANVNWPRLAQLFPVLAKLNFPKTQLQVTGVNGNLQLNGKFDLAQPLSPLEKWRMPTNTVHQPFVSFTAARGFASRLEKESWAQPYEISPTPNQLFVWALPGIPFQTFFAIPVPEANNALGQLHEKLSAHMNWQSHFMAPFAMVMTNHEITWRGMPFIAPFVQAKHENSGDFLFSGFFPNTPRSKPLPPELFARLNEPNLVYYHWEITAERLPQLQNLLQLGLVLTRYKQLPADSPGQKWISHIGPTLGNTVTEVFQTAPDELTFSRKAPGGLTAMELFAFASWLEATNFPGCDLRLPPPHFRNRKPAVPPSGKP
jgi:hypothetical protein